MQATPTLARFKVSDATALAQALAALFQEEENVWHILEWVEEIRFDAGLPALDAASPWTAGRVFGPAREARFQRLAAGFRVVVLTEEATLPALPAGLSYDPPARAGEGSPGWSLGPEVTVSLWGQFRDFQVTQRFVEVRVPGASTYPAPAERDWRDYDLAAIRAVPYLRDGLVQMLRFKAVEVKS